MMLLEVSNSIFVVKHITQVELIPCKNIWKIFIRYIGGEGIIEFDSEERALESLKNIKTGLERADYQ